MPNYNNEAQAPHVGAKNTKILTILCSGTDHNDTTEGELIAELLRGHEGKKYRHGSNEKDWDVMHLAGPGSNLSVGSPVPYKPGFFNRQNDRIFGAGIDLNIRRGADAIMAQLEDSEDDIVINMAGWSRGAVTCMGIANEVERLLEQYPDEERAAYRSRIKFNLFLVDPVPGPGNHKDKYLIVPPCVKNMTVVYAQDETRPHVAETANFKIAEPKNKEAQENREFNIIRVPGKHYDALSHLWSNKPRTVNAVWSAACNFLKNAGSQILTEKMRYFHNDGKQVSMRSFGEDFSDLISEKIENKVSEDTKTQKRGTFVYDTQGVKIVDKTLIAKNIELPKIDTSQKPGVKVSFQKELETVIRKPFHVDTSKVHSQERQDRLAFLGKLEHVCDYYLDGGFISKRSHNPLFTAIKEQTRNRIDRIAKGDVSISDNKFEMNLSSMINDYINNKDMNKSGHGYNTLVFMTQLLEPRLTKKNTLLGAAAKGFDNGYSADSDSPKHRMGF